MIASSDSSDPVRQVIDRLLEAEDGGCDALDGAELVFELIDEFGEFVVKQAFHELESVRKAERPRRATDALWDRELDGPA